MDELEQAQRRELATARHDAIGAIDRGEQVWDTDELRQDFEVVGFMAPFVVVQRRSDGVRGTLKFNHSPRIYFGWVEDK